MPKLLVKPSGTTGLVHHITPASAGWGYVGFSVYRLLPGDAVSGQTGPTEAILVMVEGHAQITAAGRDWGVMGDRLDVFERSPPHCLYLPGSSDWQAVATTPCTIALCAAPATPTMTAYPAARIGPEGISLTPRGTGTNTRYINNIAMENRDVASSLLVTEVFTPAGHWSSYPSHRHDEDDFPRMTYLEETYYMRLDPPQGFGIHRVYTEDGSLDETMVVKNHDVTLVPRGHHPVAAAYGYQMYYLNVMAGPRRNWRYQNDPDHDWIAVRDAAAAQP